MSENRGTGLYLKVEEALQDFQAGVARLKSQQEDTDSLLSKGNQALEDLALQIAQIDSMQEHVESDLRLLERFRENAKEEIGALRHQSLSELAKHQAQTLTRINNLKTDFSVRRQEILALINDLSQELQGLAKEFVATKSTLNLVRDNEEARNKTLAGIKLQVQTCLGRQEEFDNHLTRVEKWYRYLILTAIILSILALVI